MSFVMRKRTRFDQRFCFCYIVQSLYFLNPTLRQKTMLYQSQNEDHLQQIVWILLQKHYLRCSENMFIVFCVMKIS